MPRLVHMSRVSRFEREISFIMWSTFSLLTLNVMMCIYVLMVTFPLSLAQKKIRVLQCLDLFPLYVTYIIIRCPKLVDFFRCYLIPLSYVTLCLLVFLCCRIRYGYSKLVFSKNIPFQKCIFPFGSDVSHYVSLPDETVT